ELVQAESLRHFLETGVAAQVAPHAQAAAVSANVQPAVVVVIDQQQTVEAEVAERNFEAIGQSAEQAGQGIGGGNDRVRAQVIVEVARGNDFSTRPISRRVRVRQPAAAQFRQQKRRLRSAGNEQVGHIVVVPVIDDDLADSREGGGDA